MVALLPVLASTSKERSHTNALNLQYAQRNARPPAAAQMAPRGTGTSSGYPAAWENQAAPPSGTPPVPIHATPTPTSAHGVLRSDHRNAAVQYNGRDVAPSGHNNVSRPSAGSHHSRNSAPANGSASLDPRRGGGGGGHGGGRGGSNSGSNNNSGNNNSGNGGGKSGGNTSNSNNANNSGSGKGSGNSNQTPSGGDKAPSSKGGSGGGGATTSTNKTSNGHGGGHGGLSEKEIAALIAAGFILVLTVTELCRCKYCSKQFEKPDWAKQHLDWATKEFNTLVEAVGTRPRNELSPILKYKLETNQQNLNRFADATPLDQRYPSKWKYIYARETVLRQWGEITGGGIVYRIVRSQFCPSRPKPGNTTTMNIV